MKKQRLAMRYNAGKPELEYADTFPIAIEGVALNSSYGASKYKPYNYKKGAMASQSYGCARRHMLKFWNGEDLVPDAVAAGFNVHHLDAAIWNLMRLRDEITTRPELDDRPHILMAHEVKPKRRRKRY